jgi:membrane-associated phospholipid phosphatase
VAFAGAYILSKFDHDRRRKVFYALLALGVSYSRIYLLCHYAGDVAVGALYGLAVAVVTYEVVHRMYHKYHSHK